jgi:hypothetical protein
MEKGQAEEREEKEEERKNWRGKVWHQSQELQSPKRLMDTSKHTPSTTV